MAEGPGQPHDTNEVNESFGEYGNPWDVSLGMNYYPLRNRLLRWNTELLYLDDSPVGYSSVPFAVGGDGPVFYTNLELYF